MLMRGVGLVNDITTRENTNGNPPLVFPEVRVPPLVSMPPPPLPYPSLAHPTHHASLPPPPSPCPSPLSLSYRMRPILLSLYAPPSSPLARWFVADLGTRSVALGGG